ncbi:MAG: hypothetical protein PHQ48_09180, partial [Acidobacteriota bacterium]|nr:hypothetical protein [Acidobacteriota bacterium]
MIPEINKTRDKINPIGGGQRFRLIIVIASLMIFSQSYSIAHNRSRSSFPVNGINNNTFAIDSSLDENSASKVSIPRPEYPRPEFVRSEWLNLNG